MWSDQLVERMTADAGLPVPRRPSLVGSLAPLLPVLVTVGLCVYQLTRPHVLFGVYDYDDGVYFGAALRMVDGHLPYASFTFLQPPGIVVVLAPIAALARLIGEDNGLAVARAVTALVAVANVALLARLARNSAAAVAGGAVLALFPLAVSADNTVLLEPFTVLFCLLAALIAFRADSTSTGRLFAGGVVAGLAVSVKLSALVVAFAFVVAASLHRPRRRQATTAAAGVIIGAAAVAVPFLASSPAAFIHDVVVTQWSRSSSGAAAIGFAGRLEALTGASGLPILGGNEAAAWAIAAAGVTVVAAGYIAGRARLGRLDVFAVIAWATSVMAVFSTAQFFPYYSYLPAALFGAVVACAVRHLATRAALKGRPRAFRQLVALLALALAVGVLIEDGRYAGEFLAASSPRSPQVLIDAAVPAGACVIGDEPSLQIAADRFASSSARCPFVVDSYGTWLAASPSAPPGSGQVPPRMLVEEWRRWFAAADFVLLNAQQSSYLPWTPALSTYFEHRYVLIASAPHTYLYFNTRPPSSTR